MRLTNSMREKMLANIMADVPKVDYDTKIADHASALVKIWLAKAGLQDTEPARLNDRTVTFEPKDGHWRDGVSVSAKGLSQEEALILKANATIQGLVDLRYTQKVADMELRTKLSAKLNEFYTVEKLLAAAPEFKAYVPSDMPPKPAPMLPACTDIITDLTKLGWPKGKKPAAKKAPAKRTAKKGTTP